MSPSLTNDRSPLCGPLHAHINAYLKLLEERGYKQHTIRPDSLLLTDLDDWLGQGEGFGDGADRAVQEAIHGRFLAAIIPG